MTTLFFKKANEPQRHEVDDENPLPVDVMNFPSNLTEAYARESITVAGTAIGFTSGLVTAGPAVRAVCTLETAQVRVAWDGDAPTATAGHLLDPGVPFAVENPRDIAKTYFIRVGGVSATLTVTYEKAAVA